MKIHEKEPVRTIAPMIMTIIKKIIIPTSIKGLLPLAILFSDISSFNSSFMSIILHLKKLKVFDQHIHNKIKFIFYYNMNRLKKPVLGIRNITKICKHIITKIVVNMKKYSFLPISLFLEL
jgi:hypothetical protein